MNQVPVVNTVPQPMMSATSNAPMNQVPVVNTVPQPMMHKSKPRKTKKQRACTVAAQTSAAVNIAQSSEPNHFGEIKYRSDAGEWIEAIAEEIHDLNRRGTFALVDTTTVPPDERILPSKFVFQAKRDGRKKARWVAGGHRQVKQLLVDFASPTLKTTSLFTLLAIGAHKHLPIKFLDIRNAYLWADLPAPIYMALPAGYPKTDGVAKTCLLKKGLYGLKESGRLWFETLTTTLKLFSLKQSTYDPCIFYNTDRNIFLGTYVDDLIILAPDEYAKQIEKILNDKFETRVSEFDYLGISILQNKDGFQISHKRYALTLLERFGMTDCNPKPTPLPPNCMLTAASESDRIDYPMMEAAGSLLWLARYRPDLTYAAHLICKVASAPSQEHVYVFKHILQYIKGTLDFSVTFPFGDTRPLQLRAYTDANWANDNVSRKSCGGAFIYAGSHLLKFYAKTQRHIATSSTHSEVCEISRGCRELVYFKGFLEELGFPQSPIDVFTDSQSAINSTSTLNTSDLSKHYGVMLCEIRQYRDDNIIALKKVIGEDNIADLNTNQRGKVRFQHLVQLMLNPIW